MPLLYWGSAGELICVFSIIVLTLMHAQQDQRQSLGVPQPIVTDTLSQRVAGYGIEE